MRAKTVICLMILLMTAGAAAWRAARGLGPHVPIWSLGVLVIIVMTWLYVPPRYSKAPGPIRSGVLVVLSVLTIATLSTGIISVLAWSQIHIVHHGYRGTIPLEYQDTFFAQARFGQIYIGYETGGDEKTKVNARKYNVFGEAYSQQAGRWPSYARALGGFAFSWWGGVYDDRGAVVRPDGQAVMVRNVAVPFWFLALVFSAYPAWFALAAYLRRRSLRAGFCPQCRYNLTGLTVPRCPECGRPFDRLSESPRPAAS